MKKQKPKAKPGSAKKPTAVKAVKADKKVQPAAKAAKPVAKTAKPLAAKPAAKAGVVKNVKAQVAKIPPAKNPAAKNATAKPAAAFKAGAKTPVAKGKASDKPTAKPQALAPVKTGAAVKPDSAKPAAKAEKAQKPAADKAQTAPKVTQAKTEPKPIIVEEPDQAEDVVLTDADGRRYCRVKDCDRLAEVDAYCRYHYILLWKNIQTRRHILQEGKLERYIEELTARYPDKFLEILKKDLRSEKDFLAAIQELEIDESAVEAEFDDEESQSDLFEIQRVSDSGGGGARSEEDDRF
ncbi:MAG: hypothetical protein J0L82_14800 [Deltaproteobacteria bacterium]|nr:hypothetical protein [Deltaproteobacteria bacterium]